MGINFPNSPTLNQLYPQPAQPGLPVYRWDGEKWVVGGSDTAGNVRYDVAQSLTQEAPPSTAVSQRAQARMNVYAAPFDALAYNGMQINGSMEVSQEKGAASFALVANTGTYVQDSWLAYFNSAPMAITVQSQNAAAPAGYINSCILTVSTIKASLAAGDRLDLSNRIEGYRVARLAWGTASAQPITIAFWVNANIAGTMSVAIKNTAGARSYVTNVTINTPATWEYKIVTISGDTTGTWPKDNTTGLIVRLSFGAGTTYQTTPNAWAAGDFNATASTTNFAANTGNIAVTGLVVLPGVEAPSQTRAPLIMRPYDQELQTCRRYFWGPSSANCYLWSGLVVTTTSAVFPVQFPVTMRAAPTFAYSAPADYAVNQPTGQFACTAFSTGVITADFCRVTATTAGSLTAGYGAILQGITANGAVRFDARL